MASVWLQSHNEEVLGLTTDPVRKTYWVYTNQSIFELRVDNESRDVWKIYLQQEKYDVALRYAKVRSFVFGARYILTSVLGRLQAKEIMFYQHKHIPSSIRENISLLPRAMRSAPSPSRKSHSNFWTLANGMRCARTLYPG